MTGDGTTACAAPFQHLEQAEGATGRTCPSTAVSPLAADLDEAAVPCRSTLCPRGTEQGSHRASSPLTCSEVNKLKRQVLATTLLTWFQGRMSSITFHHALACLDSVLQLTGGPTVD